MNGHALHLHDDHPLCELVRSTGCPQEECGRENHGVSHRNQQSVSRDAIVNMLIRLTHTNAETY